MCATVIDNKPQKGNQSMSDHSAFQEAREPTAYRGTLTQENQRETVTLNTRGNLHISIRGRKRPASTMWVRIVMVFGLLGIGACTAIALKLPFTETTGAWAALAFMAGLAIAVVALQILMSLLFDIQRYDLPSPIDQQTIQTLKKFKGTDTEVTRDLLDIGKASRKLDQVTVGLETARERIELGGPTEALTVEVARLEGLHEEALGERSKPWAS